MISKHGSSRASTRDGTFFVKQTRWRRIEGFFFFLSWGALTSLHWCHNVSTCSHLYRISGCIHVGFGNPKQAGEKTVCFSHPTFRSTVSVTYFQNYIWSWYKTLRNVNIDRRWKKISSESDVNLLPSVLTSLSIVAYSHEQSLQSTGKNVISKGLSRVSCQSRLEINLIFVNGERVMCLEGPWGMMCEYLWLSQW